MRKKAWNFFFQTPIKKIIRETDGKVTGAIAYDKEGNEIRIKCKALIVASGGMTGNLDLMKKLGVVKTKYDYVYTDGYQVNITFPDSCQDGDGPPGRLGYWWQKNKNCPSVPIHRYQIRVYGSGQIHHGLRLTR